MRTFCALLQCCTGPKELVELVKQFFFSLDDSRVLVVANQGGYRLECEGQSIPGMYQRSKEILGPNNGIVSELSGLNYSLMYKVLHAVMKENYIARMVCLLLLSQACFCLVEVML